MDRLLACVDASVYAESVCDHAAFAAHRLSAAVDLLHVIGRRERSDFAAASMMMGGGTDVALLEELARADELNARLAEERGKALLEASRRRLEAAGVAPVTTRLESGSFVDSVIDAEGEARLIVIGKRGSNADFARLHLGSNLERVVRASARPILVASRAFRPIHRAAIAYDGGASAEKALAAAADSRLFDGVEIHVVAAGPSVEDMEATVAAAVRRLEAAGRTAVGRVAVGEAEAVIADYVRREAIDLLAMGAYGHTRLRHLIVGSTTSTMIRTCLVPVLLFR